MCCSGISSLTGLKGECTKITKYIYFLMLLFQLLVSFFICQPHSQLLLGPSTIRTYAVNTCSSQYHWVEGQLSKCCWKHMWGAVSSKDYDDAKKNGQDKFGLWDRLQACSPAVWLKVGDLKSLSENWMAWEVDYLPISDTFLYWGELYMPPFAYGSQRTTFRSLFSSSIMWPQESNSDHWG